MGTGDWNSAGTRLTATVAANAGPVPSPWSPIPSPRLRFPEREIDVRHRTLGLIRDLPELRRGRASHPRNQVGGELLLLRVVLGGRVVIELARECDLVLGGRQLFLQLTHIPRRLEIRI